MGAFEVWILVAVALLVVLVLFGGRTYDVADETIVQGISWEAADQVLFRELAGVRGLPLVEAHAGSYTLAQKYRPAWAYAAAVVLFPFGLIFLLISHEDRVQVSLSAHSSGCRLRMVGRARRRDVERIAMRIQRVLPVPDVFVR
ncbi:hypothetical protein [Aeromicrobium panaciterrae]|uniref:hypothetical protein n=1 Tax=Aeromicrobium panaciterrae TaxID=363861 RepID=UPI0031E09A05